jgi:two-component system sensor histidine kinase CreC
MFLLHQALANILQNAIDFTPRGGRIELSGFVADGSFHFTVRDFGPGIPEYAGHKIFDKFFSLQRPDTGKKSTGLGLNFVREVAILHHGSISVENNPGGGVSAVFTLPLTF